MNCTHHSQCPVQANYLQFSLAIVLLFSSFSRASGSLKKGCVEDCQLVDF